MMREILFRAKAINRDPDREYRTDYRNGDWVYGLISKLYDEESYKRYNFLFAEMTNESGISGIDVDYKTIGQYTGLTDKNGNKIFEGDICHFYGGEYYGGYWEMDHTRKIEICTECLLFFENAEYIEVIGNIYDNPELIGGDE